MKRRHFLHASTILPFINVKLLGGLDGKQPSGIRPGTDGTVAQRDFFYKPEGAWAADFIPLYANGEFQLFYLLDWRDRDAHGEGTPWYRISTKDFVHFAEHGEMLKRGSVAEQDLYVFTGSAIQAKGKYHIFYTGHNPHLRQQGKPEQGVMHAVSDDMQHWTKIPEHTFFAPSDRYEANDWRDPFVFWNEESQEYNMLLAARHKEGIPRRRGLTALCASKDLVKWEVRDSFYSPNLYFTHECPDVFKMGNWWYLVFSEFTDKVRTRYRMSRSLKGPWITPQRDDFDGHAFYAAKSASDGKRRFLFGWNPTRSDAKDNGSWNWGGNLVVHELVQQDNGELAVRIPASVARAFDKELKYNFSSGSGKYAAHGNALELSAKGSFAAATAGSLPRLCKISATVKYEKGTREFGLMFRTSQDLDQSYFIRLEPSAQQLVFDKWPRERAEVNEMVELERPVALSSEKLVHIEAIIEENKGVVYIDNQVAMNFRAYDLPAGDWGFFATDGNVVFSDINISSI